MRDYVMLGIFVIVVCALVLPQLLFLVIPITVIAGYKAYSIDHQAEKAKPINVNR